MRFFYILICESMKEFRRKSMEEKEKVSVIIPAHNAQKHIKECLDSVLAQTLREIQIICVNDGSTDDTEQIVRQFMKQDSRVRLINQINQYAGVARNRGMQEAKGDYLVFWDADDVFEKDALESMYQKIRQEDADICVCDAVRFQDGSDRLSTEVRYLKEQYLPEKTPFSIQTLPAYIFNFTTDVPWNKMYRRAFIEQHGLVFEDRERANDHYFVLRAFALAKRITLVKKHLIRYRVSSGTSLTSGLSSSPLCTYEALLHAREDLEKEGWFKNPLVVQSFANRALSSLVYGMEKQSYGEAYVSIYETLKKEGFEKLFVKDRGEEYYYTKGGYRKYLEMMELAPMEYLLREYDQISGKYARQSVRYQKLTLRHEKLQEKTSRLKEERDQYKRELDYIHASSWYRVVVFFAGLKKKLTGKGTKHS